MRQSSVDCSAHNNNERFTELIDTESKNSLDLRRKLCLFSERRSTTKTIERESETNFEMASKDVTLGTDELDKKTIAGQTSERGELVK